MVGRPRGLCIIVRRWGMRHSVDDDHGVGRLGMDGELVDKEGSGD